MLKEGKRCLDSNFLISKISIPFVMFLVHAGLKENQGLGAGLRRTIVTFDDRESKVRRDYDE